MKHFPSTTLLAPAALLTLLLGTPASEAQCVPSATTLCLNDGRHEVTTDWTSSTTSGSGSVIPLSSQTGFFSLDDTGTAEVLVRVVDACDINNRYWIYLGDLSLLATDIQVSDVLDGATLTYSQPLGSYADAILDSTGLPCPASPVPPGRADEPQRGTTAELADRFLINVTWENGGGASGTGQAIPITATSAAFYFFDPNPDVLAKIVQNDISGFYELVAGGPSNLEVTFSIYDQCTGGTQEIVKPLSDLSVVADEMFVATGCAAAIFADDFDDGTTTAWSAVAP